MEWVCPMHPEIVREAPGDCPICGMAPEPRTATVDDEENSELADMRRRFWVSVALTIPLAAVAMGEHLPGNPLGRFATTETLGWLQLLLATPVVLWGGWPFFVRGWQSVVNRSLNMFTLIALGVSVAYLYSLAARLFPGIFPPSFRSEGGDVAVYFEAAAVIVTLVLLGQVLELKARSRTGAAIRALLGLAPKTARRLLDDGSEGDVPLEEVRQRVPRRGSSSGTPRPSRSCARSTPSLSTRPGRSPKGSRSWSRWKRPGDGTGREYCSVG